MFVFAFLKLTFYEQFTNNIISAGTNFKFKDIDDFSATKSALAFVNSVLKYPFYSSLSPTYQRDILIQTTYLYLSFFAYFINSYSILLLLPSSNIKDNLPLVLGNTFLALNSIKISVNIFDIIPLFLLYYTKQGTVLLLKVHIGSLGRTLSLPKLSSKKVGLAASPTNDLVKLIPDSICGL